MRIIQKKSRKSLHTYTKPLELPVNKVDLHNFCLHKSYTIPTRCLHSAYMTLTHIEPPIWQSPGRHSVCFILNGKKKFSREFDTYIPIQ